MYILIKKISYVIKNIEYNKREKGDEMNFFSRTKEEKGSITMFVLISVMFFLIVLVGLYVSSSYKIQKQESEIKKIQESYMYENINDIYNKCEKKYNEKTNTNSKTI